MTKYELEKSILLFANEFDKEQSYIRLITYTSTPELVKLITYQMFINEFNPGNCSEELYKAYRMIHNYSKELNDKGFVIFKN